MAGLPADRVLSRGIWRQPYSEMKPRSGGIELWYADGRRDAMRRERSARHMAAAIWYANGRKEADIMNSLTVEQIQEIIPHRHPFLLLDRIEDYEPGQYAVGYKAVTYREDFFRGHFPQKAVMPGVLILEALAQTGAVAILSMPENQGKIAFFGGVQKCRFKGMVMPGDTLKLETKIIKSKGPVGVGQATAYVDGKVVVSAELTFMVGE